jgi:hypothetical protein
MNLRVAALCVCLLPCSVLAQGNFHPISGGARAGSSYSTGSGTLPSTVTGGAVEVRNRSFGSSGYFTSAGEVVDPGLALRLGDGVDPFAASGAGTQAVPEPTTTGLLALGALLLVLGRRPGSPGVR